MSLVLIVGGDDALAARTQTSIGHQCVALGPEALQGDTNNFLRGLDPSVIPDGMVLTAAVPLNAALTLAKEVSAVRPDVDIVLEAEPDPQIMLEAMRAGIRDVGASLDEPHLLGGLRTRLDRRAEGGDPSMPKAPPVPIDFTSRTIAIVSPKGGVGKTTLSSNLAVALAQQSPMEVVLVDLDLQFGDVSTVLDLTPNHTLEDAFSTAAHDNLLLKTYLTVHDGGFFVLCGADSPAANDHVTAEQITALIRQLQSQFRYVIIDTAAGIDEATLGSLEAADDVVLVSSMDISCLRSVRKEIELLHELGLMPASKHVVLNFADKQSGLKVKDVEQLLGLPVDVALPRTREVQVASNKGVPVVASSKGAYAKAVKVLAKKIYDRARAAERKPGHKRLEVA